MGHWCIYFREFWCFSTFLETLYVYKHCLICNPRIKPWVLKLLSYFHSVGNMIWFENINNHHALSRSCLLSQNTIIIIAMAELYGKTNTVNRDTVINLQVHPALSLMHAQTTHTATRTGTHTHKERPPGPSEPDSPWWNSVSHSLFGGQCLYCHNLWSEIDLSYKTIQYTTDATVYSS